MDERWQQVNTITWIVLVVAVIALVAWYLSYNAARLDRLHAKIEGSVSSLDAQIVRRAEVSLELANSGFLDPARLHAAGRSRVRVARGIRP